MFNWTGIMTTDCVLGWEEHLLPPGLYNSSWQLSTSNSLCQASSVGVTARDAPLHSDFREYCPPCGTKWPSLMDRL